MKKRVKIPRTNSAQVLALANRVREKHLADGEASLLRTLNWNELSPLIDETVVLHEKTETLKREMLMAFEQRGERIKRLVTFLRNSRDILTGNFHNEMKMLGLWGYDVAELRGSKPVEEPVMLKQSA